MGVFDLIRSLFGLGGSDTAETTDVAVEQEPNRSIDEDNASGIDDSAAAGTDATASTDSMLEEPTSDPETAAEPAEAGAGVTEHSGTDTPAAEPAEATGPTPEEGADEVGLDDGSVGEDGADENDSVNEDSADENDSVNEDSADENDSVNEDGADENDSVDEDSAGKNDNTDDADDTGGTESVETISGIGPAYAERLGDAGIETVTELLDADAAALAERTELSEKRITGWQEQASG